MNKRILSYQSNAVNFAIDYLQKNKEFNLQSPTGSGKTFIIAEMIDQYLENEFLNSTPTTFIFIAPSTGALDYQGYEKITSYLNKDWVKGYWTQYIGTSKEKTQSKAYLQNIEYFEPNKVYFFGWQMFKKGTNITAIDSEKNDIYRVINNTKDRNINIVLIIDEAHREIVNSTNDINTKNIIIQDLDPYKIIKVSATLKEKDFNVDYEITYDDVRSECAIKKNVVISSLNNKIKDIDKMCEEEQLIISALEKREEVKEVYKKKKIDMNPLILIQIPDNVNIDKDISTEKQLLDKIENILEKRGYKKGYNFAIWLNDNKTIKNKNDLINDMSSIDVLIFKTALATGWDIPRANILVRIREAKSKSFNIQTLGRILRNPLFKYYDNDLIDNAFVFTRDEKYKEFIKEDSIVVDEENYVLVDRSKKSINSEFSIKKALIDNSNYDENELIKSVTDNIINNQYFKNEFLKYEHSKVIETDRVIDSTIALGDAKEFEYEIKNTTKHLNQQAINFHSEPKITLFDLYIKFKTITKSSNLIAKIMDNISFNLYKIDIKIKDFYWACCYNWTKEKFKNEIGWINLKQLIDYETNKFINNSENIKYKYEEYHLPQHYRLSTKKYEINEWDQVNTYNVKLKIKNLDSRTEKEFYKHWIDRGYEFDDIHIFRNGTSGSHDYYIEYLNNEMRKAMFFPDFILINEKEKICLLLEAKGENYTNDIDKDSNNKFNSIIKNINNKQINSIYKCNNIIRISYDEKEEKNIFFDEINEKSLTTYNQLIDIIKNYPNR